MITFLKISYNVFESIALRGQRGSYSPACGQALLCQAICVSSLRKVREETGCRQALEETYQSREKQVEILHV